MDFRALDEQLALNPMNPKDLVQTFGLVGVWAILFAETGLLVGFFFPGDSLLFLAGVAASPVAESIFGEGARMSIVGLLIGAPICAIVGAQFGHWLGARYGKRMFDRPDSKLFKREYVEKAEYYFEKFGPAKAVVLARFIPIVRTFLNPVAGTLGMPARKFFLWNVIGAILWTDGILLVGYLLAEQIYAAIGEKIDRYILPVVALIIFVSVLPILIEILRERRAKKQGLNIAEPATAIGVVAAATVAGLADAAHDEFEKHHHHGHEAAPRSYGQPDQHGAGQHGAGQHGTGVGQHGAGQHGAGQHYGASAGQHGTDAGQQYGAGQHYGASAGQHGTGAGQPGTGQHYGADAGQQYGAGQDGAGQHYGSGQPYGAGPQHDAGQPRYGAPQEYGQQHPPQPYGQPGYGEQPRG